MTDKCWLTIRKLPWTMQHFVRGYNYIIMCFPENSIIINIIRDNEQNNPGDIKNDDEVMRIPTTAEKFPSYALSWGLFSITFFR